MLRKKMLRDIMLNKSQFITIFLMVFIGVMAYCGIEGYMIGMQDSGDRFYEENNLQDLNVIGSNFSQDDLENIKEIENVNNAERKLSITASQVSSEDKTILLNFIETNEISKFYVLDGVEFSNESGIWLDSFYAEKNDIKVGDKIKIKYDGYEFEEEVRGLINLPDHLYDVKDESQIFPEHTDFGFAYMSYTELEDYIKKQAMKVVNIDDEALFDSLVPDFNYKDNLVFNYVMVDVDEKANVSKVKDDIEEKIDSASAVIKIEDSTSYITYQGEIDEGKTYIGVFSGIFIFIALLSVITTMRRVINKQRTQIGTLKALGFRDYKIILHYISYGFFISLVAAILGVIAGYFAIGKFFIELEMTFFEVPNAKPALTTSCFLIAAFVVVCVVVITYLSCRKQLRQKPADTLRTEMPNVNAKSLDITRKGIFKKMNFSTKWNIRDMFRNKARTITGIVGVTSCCMLIVCAIGMLDSLNHFVELQFDELYNFDYKLTLKEGVSSEALEELESKYGDKTSQSYLIEIVDEDGQKESNNIFVTDASDYVRFKDNKENFITIDSDEGVYITYKLSQTEGYEVGDTIKWHLVGNDEYYESKIVGLNKDPQNQNLTMTRAYFESLGNEYNPDSLYTNVDLSDIGEIENVETIQNIESLKSGMDNMLSTMKSMIILIIVIAVVLGAVIIYNLGVLSFTEKQYQFATLKVLGFEDKKIKKIYIKQNNIIAVISIIIGLPLGYFLTDWIFKNVIEDSYDFGANIKTISYVLAAIGTFLVSYLVSKILSRKVSNIDMVSSLKGNE